MIKEKEGCVYDISQEVFSSEVYPGDPIPQKKEILSFQKIVPDKCRLTELILGSHTGTHLDAPSHFIPDGKDIGQLELRKCMGRCLAISKSRICREDINAWRLHGNNRILLKDGKKIDIEEAKLLVELGCICVGVESSTIGVEDENEEVHKILLSNEIIIIEGLRMQQVPEGEYFLCALPLKLSGVDGSPVRAVLYSCR